VVGLAVEGLFAQRGVESATPADERKLDYVDVPVFLRVMLPTPGVRPFAYAGPQASFELRCRAGPVDCADADRNLHDRLVFIGSGKLGFPDAALVAFSLGCDLVNVGREALLAIGCIQAQKCHTNHCPTGVATQNAWLSRGLDPSLKSVRLANYVVTLRKDLLALTRACGVDHPALVPASQIEILDSRFGARTVADLLGGRGRGLAPVDWPQSA
jgi:hypothetical protein